KGNSSQVTVNTDAPGGVLTERIRCELPNRMLPSRRRPGCVLDNNPGGRQDKQNGRGTDASDRHRMRDAPQQHRELIECCQARKDDSVDSPRDRPITAEPVWHPG